MSQDLTASLQAQVQQAAADRRPLRIVGSDSKAFYGCAGHGDPLAVTDHRGIIHYAPTELVITARAGTPLREIETALAAEQQMLAFEPPYFGPGATLGGTIAAHCSGPRRAYVGAARDFVLGTQLINGQGEVLHFGGEVMKNVAGYDVSRLMAGALGTLGVLLSVSLKVLPHPPAEITLVQTVSDTAALDQLHRWSALPLPVSASCYVDNQLWIRLSGTAGACAAAQALIGGEQVETGQAFWHNLKEQQHPFFEPTLPLWRLSLASNAPPLPLPGRWLYEWGGALRWLHSNASADEIRTHAQRAGGHATLFRGGPRDAVFQPLSPGLWALHRRLKQAFDPHGILNPGRLYPNL